MYKTFNKAKVDDRVRQMESTATEEEIEKTINLSISETAYSKIFKYVDLCPEEIGGLLLGTVNPEKGRIKITDITLPPQKVTGASIDYENIMPDPEDLYKLTQQVTKKGISQGVKMLGTWHSHVNMGCSASGTDEQNAKDFLTTPPMIENSLFISLIVNKKRRVFSRIDMVMGMNNIMYVEAIPIRIDDSGRRTKIKKKFKTCFTDNIPKFTKDKEKREALSEQFQTVLEETLSELFIDGSVSKECEKLYKKNVKSRYGKGYNKTVYGDWEDVDKDEDASYAGLERLREKEERLEDKITMLQKTRMKKHKKKKAIKGIGIQLNSVRAEINRINAVLELKEENTHRSYYG